MGKFLNMAKVGARDVVEPAKHVAGDLSGELVEKVLSGRHLTHHSDASVPDPWISPATPHGRPTSVASYDVLYRTLDLPPAAKDWNDDGWFAQMRVAGQNPMLLKTITALPANFPVTETHYAKSGDPGDTLARAAAEARLFMIDYHLVGEVVKDNLDPVLGGFKYTPSPLALFKVAPGKGTLHPVAIQAGQDPARFAITTPADGWAWRKAKTAVQVADANYHEMVCHLGHTHLVMEAVTLATMRTLSARHPLSLMLRPHCEGTIAINNSAANSMLAKGGAIDLSFGGTLDSMIALTSRAVADYDFAAAMPPTDFARRGVGPQSRLIDYPYRDDALRLWDAISEWTQAYVEHWYDAAKLAADPELSAWSAALSAPLTQGGIGGFSPITDTAGLAKALAMIIFTASAQHAAVNFTQWADMSYSPALAGALWAEWRDGDATEQDWLDLLPPLQFGELQAEFLALLGGVNHTRLGEYRSNVFPYANLIEDAEIVEGPLAAFRARLHMIEAAIARDNRELKTRSVPYIYLLPSTLPASINI